MGTDAVWRAGGYLAEQLLGYGASGEVWRGRAGRSGDPVALKVLHLVDESALRAARAEAALLSVLDHPNLIRLRELVPRGDDAVLVLDLAEGGSLADVLDRRGRITPGEVISALAPIGAALAYAHDQGVVHADVSAANILFTAEAVPLLADLGMARLVGSAEPARSTLAYLDPAVAAGGAAGAAGDVFMLAGVALHALTGRPPWSGSSAEEMIEAAAGGEIDGLESRLAAVPPAVADVIRRGLSAAPHSRGTAAEFALDLRHAAAPVPVELAAGRSAQVVAPARAVPHLARHAAGSPAPRPSAPPRPEPARSARPEFARPGDAPDRPPAALALTHSVRSRERPIPPSSRRWASRRWASRRWPAPLSAGAGRAIRVIAVISVLAVLGGIGAAWSVRPDRAGTSAASAAAPAPTVAPSTVPPSTAASSTVPPAGTSSAPSSSADWRLILTTLDHRREFAFGTRDPAALSGVYASAALVEQDRVTLRRVVPVGCGLTGLRTRYGPVRVVSHSTGAAVLRVTATLASATLRCSDGTVARTQARTGANLTIRLTFRGTGYAIAAQTGG